VGRAEHHLVETDESVEQSQSGKEGAEIFRKVRKVKETVKSDNG